MLSKKNPAPLNWKKILFHNSIAYDRWLQLPKDVWRLIIMTGVSKKPMLIGDFDFNFLRRLRVVCSYFARLIDPLFCQRIIYLNPNANSCKYTCVQCSNNAPCVDGRWYYKSHLQCNPYFEGECTYKMRKWTWTHNPMFGELKPPGRPKRLWFRQTIAATKLPQRSKISAALPQIIEQNVFNRQGRKLAVTLENLAKTKTIVRIKTRSGSRDWEPAIPENRKGTKFWKRNGNRKMIDRPDCTVGCDCSECTYVCWCYYDSDESYYRRQRWNNEKRDFNNFPTYFYHFMGNRFSGKEDESEESEESSFYG